MQLLHLLGLMLPLVDISWHSNVPDETGGSSSHLWRSQTDVRWSV